MLIVSDYVKGVYFFKFEKLQLTQIPHKFVDKVHCQNIVYRNKTLYLTCMEFVKYDFVTNSFELKSLDIYCEDMIVTD